MSCTDVKAPFLELHAAAHVLFYSQGHSRTGEVQDHNDSLLQRSHGEHRARAEGSLGSLCVSSVSPPLLCVSGHHPGV